MISTIFLNYIAIGVLFTYWLDDLIAADPDLQNTASRNAVRAIAILFWFPVVIVSIYAKIKDSQDAS